MSKQPALQPTIEYNAEKDLKRIIELLEKMEKHLDYIRMNTRIQY